MNQGERLRRGHNGDWVGPTRGNRAGESNDGDVEAEVIGASAEALVKMDGVYEDGGVFCVVK